MRYIPHGIKVYSALNERKLLVAIKTKKPSKDAAFNTASNNFLKKELDALIGLNHPNIVTYVCQIY
jgi:hypothetical protein